MYVQVLKSTIFGTGGAKYCFAALETKRKGNTRAHSLYACQFRRYFSLLVWKIIPSHRDSRRDNCEIVWKMGKLSTICTQNRTCATFAIYANRTPRRTSATIAKYLGDQPNTSAPTSSGDYPLADAISQSVTLRTS